MSGIVGILNLDGAPVDRRLLGRMTDFMAYRGPDAQTIWVDGPVGFGHTMLRTTFEAEHERQPFSLDGETWIIADARIDGREELIRKLKSSEVSLRAFPSPGLRPPSPTGRGAGGEGRPQTANSRQDHSPEAVPDVELILRAYQVWGEDCVHHLLGDFAFAIWDSTKHQLFCARDHFGVKLFYYARVGNTFVFSNTLNCLRLHAAVSSRLNDLAIGDFLLFGHNQDNATTTFAVIQRIPPAHTLTCSPETFRLRKYWSLPIKEQTRYKDPREYVDHFKDVLAEAVHDRLRTRAVGVYMSGGLDSTTLAATSKQLLSREAKPFDLRAYTVVYDWLIPDEERYYSGLSAEALGIPIQYLAADDYPIFGHWDRLDMLRPEPLVEPYLTVGHDLNGLVASRMRVVLYGEDGDTLLHPASILAMLKVMPVRQVVTDVIRYVLSYGRRPPLGLGIKARWNRWTAKDSTPLYPSWLDPHFEARNDLQERWNKFIDPMSQLRRVVRPKVYEGLSSPLWQTVFEQLDPGVSGFPLEVRLPFLDLRLLDFALALPPLPWCMNKELLRVSMQNTLPKAVCLRPKTPLQGDPLLIHLRHPDAHWVNDIERAAEIETYIRSEAVPEVTAQPSSPELAWINLRPLVLNHWLKHRERLNQKENHYEATQRNTFEADLSRTHVSLIREHP